MDKKGTLKQALKEGFKEEKDLADQRRIIGDILDYLHFHFVVFDEQVSDVLCEGMFSYCF